MRLYQNIVSGEVSAEWPARGGQVTQEVKAMTGERVEIRFHQDGTPVLLETGSTLALRVRATKSSDLLAELTDFEVPEDAATGFYSGRLSLNTDAILALLAASPTKDVFQVLAALEWTIPGAEAPEESDDLLFSLQRRTGAGSGDPLVMLTPWEWLKAKVQAGANLTRTLNETTKVMTLSVPDFADGREIELQAGVTHIQWRYVGEVSWTNLVALSAITGPAGADGADSTVPGPQGEDGSEIELQAGVTHIQWRYVGAMSWTDLIALSAITGPAGADGADAYPVASQAEAQAGTANDKSMTPLRTAEAIAALATGKILQVVVRSLNTTATGSTLNAWADAMSGAITPQRADSTIFMVVSGSVQVASGNVSGSCRMGLGMRVVNGGSPLSGGSVTGNRVASSVIVGAQEISSSTVSSLHIHPFTLVESHAPGTTAEQTYTLQVYPWNQTAATTLTWLLNSNNASDTDSIQTVKGVTKMLLIEVAP